MNGRILRTIIFTCAATTALSAAANAAATKPAAVKRAATQATIVMTSSGLRVNPPTPAPGPVQFTVMNKTAKARGVVVSTVDPAGSPAFRYSPIIRPGGSLKMSFWLYPGTTHFRDFTKTHVVGTERKFSTGNKRMVRIRGAAVAGRGPRIAANRGSITLTKDAVKVANAAVGANRFTVVNKSGRLASAVITGRDRTGTPIIRHTRYLKPGEKTSLNVWMYEGETYTVRNDTNTISQTVSIHNTTARAK